MHFRGVSFFLALLWAGGAFAAVDVPFLTVTSKNESNIIEWLNPPGAYSFTRIIGRTDTFAADALDFVGGDFVVDVVGIAGEHDSIGHVGLVNGTEYFYVAFVNDGVDFSAGARATGTPIDTTGPLVWAFHNGDGATGMAPPGVGAGVVLSAANDANFFAVSRGPLGGTWPPGFEPFSLGLPAQHRLPVFSIAGVTTSDKFSLVGSQDGIVRAIDVETGALIWESEDEGTVQASPAAWFEVFGAPAGINYGFFGTRNGGVDNIFHAIKLDTGSDEWTFQNDNGGLGLGIINRGASVNYRRQEVYFASHERVLGAETVFALKMDVGSLVWRRAIGDVSTSPIQRRDVLYVGADDGTIYAMNVNDGTDRVSPVSTGDGAPKGFIFPDVLGTRLYLSTTNEVHCLNDTGSVLEECWTLAIPGPSIPLYLPGSQFLWVGSADGKLYRIDVTTGTTVTPPDFTALTLGDGTAGVGAPTFDVPNALIYVGSEDGVVYALDVEMF